MAGNRQNVFLTANLFGDTAQNMDGQIFSPRFVPLSMKRFSNSVGVKSSRKSLTEIVRLSCGYAVSLMTAMAEKERVALPGRDGAAVFVEDGGVAFAEYAIQLAISTNGLVTERDWRACHHDAFFNLAARAGHWPLPVIELIDYII